MKTTFRGKQVFVQAPNPKVNQIWKRTRTDELVLVTKLIKDKGELLQCILETECGNKLIVGLAWFNNKDYVFVGTI